jgi:hypothetical protein
VAKAQLDIALRPSGERWAVPNDASGVMTLVDRGKALLTRVGFLKNSDLASRLAAYCGDLNNPQTQGGKPCFARPLSTNG